MHIDFFSFHVSLRQKSTESVQRKVIKRHWIEPVVLLSIVICVKKLQGVFF